jgi:BTB/POZ domain/Pentapeptide repeats (8 copies)
MCVMSVGRSFYVRGSGVVMLVLFYVPFERGNMYRVKVCFSFAQTVFKVWWYVVQRRISFWYWFCFIEKTQGAAIAKQVEGDEVQVNFHDQSRNPDREESLGPLGSLYHLFLCVSCAESAHLTLHHVGYSTFMEQAEEEDPLLRRIAFTPHSPTMTLDSSTPDEPRNVQLKSSKQIKLDVGGYKFSTTLTTLTSDPDCMLAAMFSGRFPVEKNEDGCVFIDRDGQFFHHILNWLRNGTLPPIENHLEREYLMVESKYYQISSLNEYLLAQDPHPHTSDPEEKFTLKELLQLVNNVPPGRKLQLASADMRGLNLDGISLQGANVKFAKLDRATLQFANLQEIIGQNASLNHAGTPSIPHPSNSLSPHTSVYSSILQISKMQTYHLHRCHAATCNTHA